AATQCALDLLHPSDSLRRKVLDQLRLCQRRLRLDARLPAILAGEGRPTDASELLEAAELCAVRNHPATAAQLADEAFASDDPPLSEEALIGHRYVTACAAAIAGFGKGEDSAGLSKEQRTHFREQARRWLKDELAAMAAAAHSTDAEHRDDARQCLKHWLV